MSDIFISYSTHDRGNAKALCESLRSSGYSVWLDETNISAAMQWSSEIVRAIEESKVFIILLSTHSFASHNVSKELSLASEKKKHIIPVELERVDLPHEFQYQLAGIQRVSVKDTSAIMSAVARFTGNAESDSWTRAEKPKYKAKAARSGKLLWSVVAVIVVAGLSFGAYLFMNKPTTPKQEGGASFKTWKIAVLPFESLSSDKDDEYFADGLTAEVIGVLTPLSGMRIVDRKTAMGYKGKKADARSIADALHVRYIVDGTVQRQGKEVKLSIQLIDARSGKTILADDFDGTLENGFALQERLSRMVAFDLQHTLNITFDTSWLAGMGSPEAIIDFEKGADLFERQDSLKNLNEAIAYFKKSTEADPHFSVGYFYESYGYLARFIGFGRAPRDLILADSTARVCERSNEGGTHAHLMLAMIAKARGDTATELREATEQVLEQPDESQGYQLLASCYYERRQLDLAASAFESAVKKDLTDLSSWNFLLDCLHSIGDTVRTRKYTAEAQPLFDRYLERNPYNWFIRQQYALNLSFTGDKEACHRQIEKVLESSNLQKVAYYNIACAYSNLNEPRQALDMLKRASETAGDIGSDVATDPDFKNISAMPEFKALAASMDAAGKSARDQ